MKEERGNTRIINKQKIEIIEYYLHQHLNTYILTYSNQLSLSSPSSSLSSLSLSVPFLIAHSPRSGRHAIDRPRLYFGSSCLRSPTPLLGSSRLWSSTVGTPPVMYASTRVATPPVIHASTWVATPPVIHAHAIRVLTPSTKRKISTSVKSICDSSSYIADRHHQIMLSVKN